MALSIKLTRNSAFNNKKHFFYCLADLVNEWEDVIGAKEMDTNDCGFNYARLLELKAMIKKEVETIGD
jgi:hypothetical protein